MSRTNLNPMVRLVNDAGEEILAPVGREADYPGFRVAEVVAADHTAPQSTITFSRPAETPRYKPAPGDGPPLPGIDGDMRARKRAEAKG